jgi:hypothetical protein
MGSPTTRTPWIALAALACSVVVAACGSSSKPTDPASGVDPALKLAQCMRANGVPDFPDPTETAPGGAARALVLQGMAFAIGPGISPKSPAFRQAASRCGVRTPR